MCIRDRSKTLSILAARLGRAVYLVLKRGDVFDETKFLQITKADVDLMSAPTKKRRSRSKKNTTKKETAAMQTQTI